MIELAGEQTSVPQVGTKEHIRILWLFYLESCGCAMEHGAICTCPARDIADQELTKLLGPDWHGICRKEWAD